jgi:hypothetical protein
MIRHHDRSMKVITFQVIMQTVLKDGVPGLWTKRVWI